MSIYVHFPDLDLDDKMIHYIHLIDYMLKLNVTTYCKTCDMKDHDVHIMFVLRSS